MSDSPPGCLELAVIDEAVLDRLMLVATTDAEANDVTPPLTPGNTWTSSRVDWFRQFHRDRRVGIDGKAGEATWAVIVDGHVVGSVRLNRIADRDILETGVWLSRSARGHGVARSAVATVVRDAAALGASAVVAETTASNSAALGVLHALGFMTGPPDASGRVRSVLQIESRRTVSPGDQGFE